VTGRRLHPSSQRRRSRTPASRRGRSPSAPPESSIRRPLGGSFRFWFRSCGSHLRLLVASGAGVPPRCAGGTTPSTLPLRPPWLGPRTAPIGVIDPHRLHQASFSARGRQRSLPLRSHRRSRASRSKPVSRGPRHGDPCHGGSGPEKPRSNLSTRLSFPGRSSRRRLRFGESHRRLLATRLIGTDGWSANFLEYTRVGTLGGDRKPDLTQKGIP
jgi:hypothetical protein